MILTDRVVTVNGDNSKLDSKIYLYRGDKNIQINLSVVNSRFKFTNKADDNIGMSTAASYSVIRLITPNGSQITFPMQPILNGQITWLIEEELINDIDELGNYNIQIRLLNEDKDSIITIPPILEQIEVLEPIFVEDPSANTLGAGTVGKLRLSPYSGVQRDTLLSDGNYNKKDWVDEEVIYKEDLNTLEDISYKNRQKLLEHDEQFNTIESEKADSKLNQISKSKSCVTIIFDDISVYDYTKLFPILKEKNVNIGQACLTEWVGTYNNNTQFATWEQIKEMSDFGNEIISHSIRQDVHYTDMTDIELDNYFRLSKETLRSKGYTSDLLAYTWGDSDSRIRKYARKYYKAGFAIFGAESVKNSNGSTLNTYDIARVGLNGEDNPQAIFTNKNTDSLEYLKERVDYAKANNQWLVFMGHAYMFTDTSKNKIQQFKDLIDYIRSAGLEIVTPSVGLERMGNQIDLVANEDETKYFKLNSKGQIKSNVNDVWEVDTFSSSNKCKDFRHGISVTSISTPKAQTDGGFPVVTGGTLVTYNPFSGDLGYQEYIAFNGLRWQRWVNSDGSWSAWLNILPPKLYNTTITVPIITIPSKQSYNYTFKTSGALTNLSDATIYPTTNVENGLIFNHWIMPDGTFVIRFSNFTDDEITTVAREWKLTSIQLR